MGRELGGAPRLLGSPSPLPVSGLGTREGKPAWRLAAPVGITQGLSRQSLGRQGALACPLLPSGDGAV